MMLNLLTQQNMQLGTLGAVMTKGAHVSWLTGECPIDLHSNFINYEF